jgi:hypothetical protein
MPITPYEQFVIASAPISPTGTELIAVIQAGVTKSVTVNQLKAGPTNPTSTVNVQYPNGNALGDAGNQLLNSTGHLVIDVTGAIHSQTGSVVVTAAGVIQLLSTTDSAASAGLPGQTFGLNAAAAQVFMAPGNVGRVALVAQTVTIGITTIYAPAPGSVPDGEYLVNVVVTCTVAGAGGTVTCTITWTDENAAQTFVTTVLNLNALGHQQATQVIHVKTPILIRYQTTVAGASGGPQYSLYINVQKVG